MACSPPEIAQARLAGSWPSSGQGGTRRALTTALPRLALRGYRLVISPLLGHNCRFEPSCSRFAEQALARYGLAAGGLRAIGRLLRCHPWSPGGFDPVP